jgi:hypothetical protein
MGADIPKDGSSGHTVGQIAFYPICFLFDSAAVLKTQKAKRVYPFDTGASQLDLYMPSIQRRGALMDYSVLPPTMISVRQLIKSFFDMDEAYLDSIPKTGLSFQANQIEANSYYRLITGERHPDCDDRCSAIEVQITEEIDLCEGALLAVVLPTFFLDKNDRLIDAIVRSWHAQLLTYSAGSGQRPLEFHGAIRQKVLEFYEDSNLIQ